MLYITKPINRYFTKFLRYYSKNSTCSITYCNRDLCFNQPGCKKYITSSVDDDYFYSVRRKNNTSSIGTDHNQQYKNLNTSTIGIHDDLDIIDHNSRLIEPKKIQLRSITSPSSITLSNLHTQPSSSPDYSSYSSVSSYSPSSSSSHSSYSSYSPSYSSSDSSYSSSYSSYSSYSSSDSSYSSSDSSYSSSDS